jgi:hypothetical protein
VSHPGLRRGAWLAPVAFLASCGEASAAAMRASAVVGLLALGAALVRRGRPQRLDAASLEVRSRAFLGRDAGIAIVRAGGESLLVGFGRDGVRLLSRLGREGTP